jgi:hypothetical protein
VFAIVAVAIGLAAVGATISTTVTFDEPAIPDENALADCIRDVDCAGAAATTLLTTALLVAVVVAEPPPAARPERVRVMTPARAGRTVGGGLFRPPRPGS